MHDDPFQLTAEMVSRLRAVAVTSTPPGQRGMLASANYYGQGRVDVPAAWLVEILDRMDQTGLPAE